LQVAFFPHSGERFCAVCRFLALKMAAASRDEADLSAKWGKRTNFFIAGTRCAVFAREGEQNRKKFADGSVEAKLAMLYTLWYTIKC
jgi:hypothetical protein